MMINNRYCSELDVRDLKFLKSENKKDMRLFIKEPKLKVYPIVNFLDSAKVAKEFVKENIVMPERISAVEKIKP